jgi:deoxyribodipyrimidine photo-lyase
MKKINIFWFRKDLRLEDNCGLYHSLKDGVTQPIFIFNKKSLANFSKDSPRPTLFYNQLKKIDEGLRPYGGSLKIYIGEPKEVFSKILKDFPQIKGVFVNEDYSPYARKRDEEIKMFLARHKIEFFSFKDRVIFSPWEIVKEDKVPYKIYTFFKNAWLKNFNQIKITTYPSEKLLSNINQSNFKFIEVKNLHFTLKKIELKPINWEAILNYHQTRDFPYLDGTSFAGPHLSLGFISPRKMVDIGRKNSVFLSELIWREFFVNILYHFPYVIKEPFQKNYLNLKWKNNLKEFERWKTGTTGFPLVDAGMRELNQTGYIHNRVRMVCASFLVKDLLIDWRWGERYFADKLIDYDLASNNGNWQWVAGCGTDAAPYFRIFNPLEQQKKFDPDEIYISKWIKEFKTESYPKPMVDHKAAYRRALEFFGKNKVFMNYKI